MGSPAQEVIQVNKEAQAQMGKEGSQEKVVNQAHLVPQGNQVKAVMALCTWIK